MSDNTMKQAAAKLMRRGNGKSREKAAAQSAAEEAPTIVATGEGGGAQAPAPDLAEVGTPASPPGWGPIIDESDRPVPDLSFDLSFDEWIRTAEGRDALDPRLPQTRAILLTVLEDRLRTAWTAARREGGAP